MIPFESINMNTGKGRPACRRCGAAIDPVPGQLVQVCAKCGQQHLAETWDMIEPEYEADVLATLSATRDLIKSIKLVRERSTLTLKPARDYVVGLAARNGITLAKGGCALVLFEVVVGLAAAASLIAAHI